MALLLIGCGSSPFSDDLTREQLNKRCFEGLISGEYIVKYKSGVFKKIHASSNSDFLKKIEPEEHLIEAVDYNFSVKIKKQQSSTHSSNTFTSKEINLGTRLIQAPSMWAKGFYGEGIKIGLIDTGYDIDHKYLRHSVAINSEELGNDEDKNGFKGDLYGWDFINNKPLEKDLGRHGTTVGGLIATRHFSNFHIGVAPKAKIVPIAALEPGEDITTDVSGETSSILKALDYAQVREVDVINASWGGEICSPFIEKKIREITDSGTVFVTASGNESKNIDENLQFPASLTHPLVLTVGGVFSNSERYPESNYGQSVDFFTLGASVFTTAPNNGFAVVNGSSAATPFLVGAWALMKEAFPSLESQVIVDALKETSAGATQKTPRLNRAYDHLIDKM